jgi:hypothetical protein
MCSFGLCDPELLSLDDATAYVYEMGIDADHVYMGSVERLEAASKSGGVFNLLCAGMQIAGVVAQGDYVYYLGLFEGSVNRVAKTGGKCQKIALTGHVSMGEIRADADAVYFTTHNPPGIVGKVSIKNGAFSILADGGDAYWDLGIDETYAYWRADSGIYRGLKKDGSEASLLVNLPEMSQVVPSATHVYFKTGTSIMRVPKMGGTPEMVTTEKEQISVVLVDDTHVFWRTPVEGAVRTARFDGSAVQTLAVSYAYDYGGAFAIDDKYVYWIGGNENRLYRTPK